MSLIFVIDDESPIRSLCSKIFTKDGHEVMTFSTGEEALRTIAQHRPDLILMDIHIPGETGLSLLKRFPNQNRIPVAVFSGYVTQDIEKQAYAAGAIDVISKAIGGDELRARVRKLLEANQRQQVRLEKDAKKEKILIVDDEEGIRNLLQGFFEERGYPALTAKSGEEAIALVQKEHPAMILLDINMSPGLDGIQTLKKIREIDSRAGVVMATGILNEEVMKAASDLGAYAFVSKPFDMQYLDLVVLTRLVLSSCD